MNIIEILRELNKNYPYLKCMELGVTPLSIISSAKKNGFYEDDNILIIAWREESPESIYCNEKWEFDLEWMEDLVNDNK